MIWSDLPKLLVQATLIVAGWAVVYRLQGLQSRRKALREQVDAARQLVKKARGMAIAFHTAPSFDHQQHEELLELIADIDRHCQLFPKIVRTRLPWPNAADPKECAVPSESLVALRRAITLEHFDDDPSRMPLLRDAEQIACIQHAADDLLATLDRITVAALD